MKPLLIYHSRTGNTELVAEALAEALEADVETAEGLTQDRIAGRRLVGLGSGIYWLRHDPSVFQAADRVPGQAKVFIFTTSGLKNRLLVTAYQYWLKRRLKRRGLEIVGQWHCPGHDKSTGPLFGIPGFSKGRPDQEDLAAARAFGREMKSKNV